MTRAQVIERIFHAFDHLHRLLQNPLGQRHDVRQIRVSNLAFGKMPVRLLQIAAEVDGAIAVNLRIHPLDFVENIPDMRRR